MVHFMTENQSRVVINCSPLTEPVSTIKMTSFFCFYLYKDKSKMSLYARKRAIALKLVWSWFGCSIMYCHSRTLFRHDDGTKMKFVVLRSSFDANIVSSLIQWGGGSVLITDEPIAGAVNLSGKILFRGTNYDMFNTSFIHGSCLSNSLLDIKGFSLGRSHLRESSGSNSEKITQSTLHPESLLPPPCTNESVQDLVMEWLKDASCGAVSSHETTEEESKGKKKSRSITWSFASVPLSICETVKQSSVDSEIWPHNSASAVKCNFIESSFESPEVLMKYLSASLSADAIIAHRVDKWLGSTSFNCSGEERM